MAVNTHKKKHIEPRPCPQGRGEHWGSKLGIILAVAGSAVGLGNFLRFPVQAAQNGGGAFMIPYFIALFTIGIPLSLVEWTIGRHGGMHGHNTAAGAFGAMWQRPIAKYLGLLGVFGPLVIYIYYIYIESWTLGYSFFAITGKYNSALTEEAMRQFLSAFQGLQRNDYFNSISCAYTFFMIAFLLNLWVLKRGIRRGIELINKIALPTLLVLALLVVGRVLTLKAPLAAHPDWNALSGLGFMWNPDFRALADARVWLAAAGQILFTLSVGIGVIVTYASYLKEDHDVTLSSTSAVSTNEFAEVILGGSIVLPAAFMFFGPLATKAIAESGAFNLGFVTMPLVMMKIPLGNIFGCIWFLLLFLAGLTSSVSLAQPAIAFMKNVCGFSHRKCIWIFGAVTFALIQPVIFLLARGVMDELDFWGGTFCLVVFATFEVIIFGWAFGIERGWKEMHKGAEIRIPVFFKFIIKYVTPACLLLILGFWTLQKAAPTFMMQGVLPENRFFVLATRVGMIILILTLGLVMHMVLRRRRHIRELEENI